MESHQQMLFWITDIQRIFIEIMSVFIIITVPADGLMVLGHLQAQ